jgi:hypothetical protein
MCENKLKDEKQTYAYATNETLFSWTFLFMTVCLLCMRSLEISDPYKIN